MMQSTPMKVMMIRTTMMSDGPEFTEIAVCVDNERGLIPGENLPNHTAAMRGRGKFVMASAPGPFIVRTKQEAYRVMAHLNHLAQDLPDEDGEHSFEEVMKAVTSLYK